MKKIALTSLLAVFAVSGAHAANVIDGNPLYMPKAGHFYSETAAGSHTGTKEFRSVVLNEDFGYGITDKLAVNVSTSIKDDRSFDKWSWEDMAFGAKFRALDLGAWKMDLIGVYTVDNFWPDHQPWLKKELTNYEWTAGVRGGYVASWWTVAGHALFNYENTESFRWNKDGVHTIALGIDGQMLLGRHFALLAGVEYTGRLDNADANGIKIKNAGKWTGEVGVNYNFDATKYIGLYADAEMDHKGGNAGDDWDLKNGFGFGAKFGIDF